MLKPFLQLDTGRIIGPGHPTYIIAEIGSNHDGSLEKAKRLIQQAHQAGADAVKFQSFQAHTLVNNVAKVNGHWETHNAWNILEKLTLLEDWHAQLQEYSNEAGIDFLSAPFDEQRLHLLDALNVPVIKIASGDLTHHYFLHQVGLLKKPVILSTGIATLGEVEAALRVLEEAGCDQVALLHCVSLYPPTFADANIRAMVTMHQAFQVPVGYSDHTPGHTVPLGAVALGGCIIEKHITDDKTLPGPDHPYALDIAEFTEMVTQIRNLEAALGDGLKRPAPGEVEMRAIARRGIYTKEAIPQGAVLTLDKVKMVRNAYDDGIKAEHYAVLVDKKATCDIAPNTLLTWEMFAV